MIVSRRIYAQSSQYLCKTTVSFASVEQLAEAMYALARVLDTEVDAFAQADEPERPPAVREDAAEIDALFAELEAMERERLNRVPN